MKLAFVFLIFLATTQVDAGWFEKLKWTFNKYKADVTKVSSLIKSAQHAVKKLVSHAMTFWKKPKFCHKLDCPTYKVVKKGSNYEKRCYKSAMWVATEAKAEHGGFMFKGVTSKMFKKLFRYIEGENDKKMKISMTAPVLVQVESTPGKKEKLFRMHFYVPSEMQEDVPKPTEKDVFTKRMGFCAYVREFSGYVFKFSKNVKEVKKLKSDLKRDGLEGAYDPNVFASAGYDSPWKLFNRHNEVWLFEKKEIEALETEY